MGDNENLIGRTGKLLKMQVPCVIASKHKTFNETHPKLTRVLELSVVQLWFPLFWRKNQERLLQKQINNIIRYNIRIMLGYMLISLPRFVC